MGQGFQPADGPSKKIFAPALPSEVTSYTVPGHAIPSGLPMTAVQQTTSYISTRDRLFFGVFLGHATS